VQQVGPKDSGNKNLIFLALKAEAVCEVQILRTATARDIPRNFKILIFSLFLKKVTQYIFDLQFLFLKSSKIFIIDEVMDICVKIIFFKILTTLDSHTFGAKYQNTYF
jgi:hypothetical protein